MHRGAAAGSHSRTGVAGRRRRPQQRLLEDPTVDTAERLLRTLLAAALLSACGGDGGTGPDLDPDPGPVQRPAVLWGVDANYVGVFEDLGYRWTVGGRAVDVIDELAVRGAQVFRLRVWVEDEPGSLEPGTLQDAAPLARRAQRAGMYVIPTLLMSQGWGEDTRQKAPAAWAQLDLEARADTARAWARMAARRLAGFAVETPVIESPILNARAGGRALVKAECLQRTNSFKIRGALNRMLKAGPEKLEGGVVAAAGIIAQLQMTRRWEQDIVATYDGRAPF